MRGDTITADKPEVTTKAPGHWRCVFEHDKARTILDEAEGIARGWRALGEGWVAPWPYPSEEIADEMGRVSERRAHERDHIASWRYVRAEYFPPAGDA